MISGTIDSITKLTIRRLDTDELPPRQDGCGIPNFHRDQGRAKLERAAFKTSRLLEFCSQRELVAQTGQAVETWPLVILKELVDNALDEAEETGIAPVIEIEVSTKRA